MTAIFFFSLGGFFTISMIKRIEKMISGKVIKRLIMRSKGIILARVFIDI